MRISHSRDGTQSLTLVVLIFISAISAISPFHRRRLLHRELYDRSFNETSKIINPVNGNNTQGYSHFPKITGDLNGLREEKTATVITTASTTTILSLETTTVTLNATKFKYSSLPPTFSSTTPEPKRALGPTGPHQRVHDDKPSSTSSSTPLLPYSYLAASSVDYSTTSSSKNVSSSPATVRAEEFTKPAENPASSDKDGPALYQFETVPAETTTTFTITETKQIMQTSTLSGKYCPSVVSYSYSDLPLSSIPEYPPPAFPAQQSIEGQSQVFSLSPTSQSATSTASTSTATNYIELFPSFKSASSSSYLQPFAVKSENVVSAGSVFSVTSASTPIFAFSIPSNTNSNSSSQSVASSQPTVSSQSLASNSSRPTYTASTLPISYGSGSAVIAPSVGLNVLHGPSSNDPSNKYIPWNPPQEVSLASSILTPGVDGALSTNYGLSPDTGILVYDESAKDLLADMDGIPHLSRDGGKGGYLDGQKMFIFCDTGSYANTTEEQDGNFLGFVSSSVAIDIGSNGKDNKSLVIQDGIAQWSDSAGRTRGFSPLTTGEQSYNLVMQGQGYRYAIWPESSIIPLNETSALLYSPIVYLQVDMTSKAHNYTYTGTTLLLITAQAEGGPRADRIVDKLFMQDEVEWGTIGGIRSYGSSGMSGNDGMVYVFGCIKAGLLIGRVDADKITERDSYQYWDGATWGNTMQSHTSSAVFVSGAFMDGDIIYSPYHMTFIFVYLNPYADNTFYYRYLMADHALLPPSAPGADPTEDYVGNMMRYPWSKEETLFKAPAGPQGQYIYAGGIQAGYFDEDDITNGGKKMLLSWTMPTGQNPASLQSEYSFMTAQIQWS